MTPLDLTPYLITSGPRVTERRQRAALAKSAASAARTRNMHAARLRFEGRAGQ